MGKHVMYGDLKVFGGRAHPELVREIGEYLNLELGSLFLRQYLT